MDPLIEGSFFSLSARFSLAGELKRSFAPPPVVVSPLEAETEKLGQIQSPKSGPPPLSRFGLD